jgi:hypothetical protein
MPLRRRTRRAASRISSRERSRRRSRRAIRGATSAASAPEPSLLVARVLLFGYVASRMVHFVAYLTARTHDTRATLWSIGSFLLVYMTARTLLAALGV